MSSISAVRRFRHGAFSLRAQAVPLPWASLSRRGAAWNNVAILGLHHELFPFDVHPRRHPGCVSDWMGTRSALDRDESKGGLIQGWADDS